MSLSVCLFCGSRPGHDPLYPALAEATGKALARRGWTLVYGGGALGLMGIAARAALAAGGRVIGVIPEFLVKAEVAQDGLSELFVVDTMHARKRLMADLSDAFLSLPGGIGTLDETIEMMTWTELKLHDKPIILTGPAAYWLPLTGLISHVVAEGMGHPRLASVLTMEPVLDNALDRIASHRPQVPENYSPA